MLSNKKIKIEEKISESSATAVYRAFDELLHRSVLLKVLHKHLANDEDLRARFIREARACAALRSEHIVQVYNLTEMDGAPAIVMEFVEGISLKDGIDRGTHIGFAVAKKTALHVLRGLAVAHTQGIIHRDIKPGNILVSNDGVIKVTDFGLAYVAMSPTVTIEGMVLGTPAYMSPEQARGEDVDARTDLFSLGATLVEVLSGERLFEGSTYSECMKKILAFKEPELERFQADSSNDFVMFLQKLMHPQREERFATAKQAMAALSERKSSIIFHPVEYSSRRRSLGPAIIGIFAAVLLLAAAFLLPLEQWKSETQEQNISRSNDTIKALEANRSVPLPNPAVLKKKENAVPIKRKKITTATVVQDSGTILLTSNPWAKVYVNNLFIGETPLAKQVKLAPGTHTVMFTNPFFDPIIRTVRVEPNKEITIVGNFLETVGYVLCTAIPWADIYVDEQYKETTPLSKPLMLAAGKRLLRFKNSAFNDIVQEVNVTAQDTVRLTIKFEK